MEETLNVVNDTQETNVESQETAVETVVESEKVEVAPTQPTEKPVQSKEDNAKFAEVRKKAEAEAKDKLIDEMYGESHNIHTKAEYDKAMAKQKEAELIEKMKESDADPELVKQELFKQWEQSDPRLREYESNKLKTYEDSQLAELNKELKEIGLTEVNTLEDISSLDCADKVIDYIKNGKTLSEAYFLANKKEIISRQANKIQQETIAKIQANGEATPGSLADTSKTPAIFTKEQVDNMSVSDITKNYDLVMKSMKTWK